MQPETFTDSHRTREIHKRSIMSWSEIVIIAGQVPKQGIAVTDIWVLALALASD